MFIPLKRLELKSQGWGGQRERQADRQGETDRQTDRQTEIRLILHCHQQNDPSLTPMSVVATHFAVSVITEGYFTGQRPLCYLSSYRNSLRWTVSALLFP